MSGDEPVVAPDQLKVGHHTKTWRIAGVITAVAMIAMVLLRNHHGTVEDIWLVASAIGVIVLIAADSMMRKRGLKR